MQRLLPHPDFRYPPGTYVESRVNLSQTGVMRLRYVLGWDGTGVRLPPPAASARKSDLWRHTCCEAFVRARGRDGYVEINLSPSSEWAVYAFDAYRAGMRPVALSAPSIRVDRTPGRLELNAEVDISSVLPAAEAWQVGLTAVVEGEDGLSYWALAHAPGRPDFHHPDCFALDLPATGQP